MEKDFQKFIEFRKLFPVYNQGIYLNYAAISPFSQLNEMVFIDYYNKRSHLPVDIYDSLEQIKEKFKINIEKLINAESGKNIAVVPNTSVGLNIVAQGLKLKKNDRVLLNTMEFPANIYPFVNLENKGIKIDWIEPKNGKILLEQIEKSAKKRTKIISISFVQFLNGFKAELKEIGEFCRDNNIIFVVDGIQGAGVIPLDVQQYYIDAFSTGGHKWLMWPMGTGFLYLSNNILKKVEPVFAGWLSVKDSWNFFDYKLDFLDSADKYEPGTLNFLGLVSAEKMLKKFLELGIKDINARILELTDRLIEGLKDLGIDIVTPEEKKYRSGIVSIKTGNNEKVFKKLLLKNIFLSLREDIIRFSVHCTNTEEEINVLLKELKNSI